MSDTMKQDKNTKKQAGLRAERPLPEPFQDLEPYLVWSLSTDRERSAKRQASTMDEITAFYQAMLPRMDEILSCLEQYPPERVPTDVKRLFFLTLSLAKIAPAVEMYGEPNAEGLDALRLVNVDIYPTRS